jgi:tetratricopeptide (TPR) repeat protein
MKFSFFKKKEGKEDFEQTLEKYRKDAEANPQDLRIRTKIAELYLGHGDTEKAVTEYLASAGAYREAGKNKIVTSIYTHVLSIDPGRIEVYHLLCDAYMQSYLVGDAVETLVKLATYYYEHDLHYEAAQALKSIHDIDPGNTFYKSKVEKFYRERSLSPEEIETIGPKGKWTLVQKKTPGKPAAEEPANGFFDLEKVLDESSIHSMASMEQLIQSEEAASSSDNVLPEQVFEKLKDLVGSDPKQAGPDFHYNLGLAYMNGRQHEQALEEFQKALEGITNKLGCYSMLTECSMALKRYDAAKEFISGALKLDGLTGQDTMNLNYQLGLVYKAQGDRKKALKIFKKIHDTDRNFKAVVKEINELS